MLKTVKENAIKKSPWRYLGRIRLGRKDEKGYPQDLDHFVIPAEYQKVLGDRPQELKIMLAHPTLEENFDTGAAIWNKNGSKMCWTRDDVTAQRYELVNPQGGQDGPRQWVTIPCPNLACEYRQSGRCTASGLFRFMVPETQTPGIFDLSIKSTVGIQNLYSVLDQLKQMVTGRPNGMHGIRMVMRREEKEFHIDIKGDGKQATIKKWIVSLEVDAEALMAEDARRLMLETPAPRLVAQVEDEGGAE